MNQVSVFHPDHGVSQGYHLSIRDYFSVKGIRKKWADIKVMVSFNHGDSGSMLAELLQLMQNCYVAMVDAGLIPDPEFKDIAHENKVVYVAAILIQELE